MRALLSFIFLVFISIDSFAQGFSLIDGGFVNVGRSSVAWGDYDSDGDLDALITGDHGSGPYVAAIYRNDAGEFANINAGLTGIYNSAVAWGDYDNDGDPDILACGRNSSNSKTFIYRNDNGAFIQLEAGLPTIGSDGAVAWGDYDNDGDLDALIAGAYSCRIFNNTNGVFTDIAAGLPAVSNCWVDWGDFDNDGDLDIFVMGDIGGMLKSAICRNDQGIFTEIQTAIKPLAGGSSSWCDFDKDHDLDLLLTGFDEFLEPNTTIYSNLGNMEFMDVYPGLMGASLGTAAWADYDNDGDADILLTGQNAGCGTLSSMVYRNDDNTIFTDIDAPLDGAERGSAAWADFDNDGDADILISGITGAGTPATKLYLNLLGSNSYSANLPPSVPNGLQSLVDGHAVTLSWNNSSDDYTPAAGLTYNIRIGSSPGAQDVLSAMADATTGKRLLPQSGNSGSNTSWVINLPDGTYYWSVQALDHTYSSSAFATESTFTVLNTGFTEPEIKAILTSPIQDQLLVKIPVPGKASLSISDITGRETENINFENEIRISSTDWADGIYIVKIQLSNTRALVKKIIKY